MITTADIMRQVRIGLRGGVAARMDFAYTEEDEAFKAELKAWLDERLPTFLEKWADADQAETAGAGASGVMAQMERRRAWQRLLNEGAGRRSIGRPSTGAATRRSPQNVIYSEVMAEYRTPGIYNANGLWQIGPMIIKWGTDEQRERWIPNILNADDHWVPGASASPRPAATSRTSARSRCATATSTCCAGRKIWTSSAHIAKWGLFLVRTDEGAIERGAKHEGITALIIDLEAPGIEINPIRDIAGEEMFCEVFFDDARVPAAYRLGGEGEGWLVAMGTLGRERVGTAGLAIGMRADLDAMVSLARSVNPQALEDPALRERIARAHTDIEYTKLLNYRALSKILKNQKNWPEVPLAKLQWSHLAQTLAELAVDLLGPAGMMAKGAPEAADGGSWNRLYVFQRYTSIGAGTTEVQKNILADKAIRLPRK